jgi:autonomous glycyl radical cofactor GrcA
MLQTITPEVCNKFGEIGFEEDDINSIQMLHELKTRNYSVDIKKLINQVAFKHLTVGISETFEKNMWNDENFFEIVEKVRGGQYVEKY